LARRAKNFLRQQAKFDQFIDYYNTERPRQALEGRCPAQFYKPLPRPYAGLGELEYPLHDRTVTVTACGRICMGRRKINLSGVFAGQNIGIKEVAERIWLVSFMHYDLGFFDHETGRVVGQHYVNRSGFSARWMPMLVSKVRRGRGFSPARHWMQ
jgi:putative transposase